MEILSTIFTHTHFDFHVCDLKDIFTYTSGIFTDSFYDIFTKGKNISRMETRKLPKKFTAEILIFTGKKRCRT